MFLKEDLKELEELKNNLEKKDIDLIIADFDDTIFSTHEVLSTDIRKGRRGNEGNKYIKEVIGIDNFIEKIYKGKSYPKTISSKLRENHDLILTAGFEELQEQKLIITGLNHINFKVVYEAESKIIEAIRYVVNNLGFIPHKITVYEDRPKFFIEHKNLIETFLGTELEIMYVEMKDNSSEPTIKKVD